MAWLSAHVVASSAKAALACNIDIIHVPCIISMLGIAILYYMQAITLILFEMCIIVLIKLYKTANINFNTGVNNISFKCESPILTSNMNLLIYNVFITFMFMFSSV